MSSLYSGNRAQASVFMSEFGTKAIHGKVLDLGCGNKPYKRISKNHTHWVGVDIRPVGDVQADMGALPLEDGSFDTVLCNDALQFHLAPIQVLQEARRVLSPNGTLVMTVPGTRMETAEEAWGFKVNGLAWLLKEAGFEVTEIQVFGGTFKNEGENFLLQYPTGTPMDLDLFQGWLRDLDKRYPSTLGVIAKKV